MGKWRQALIHQLNGPHLNEEENNPIFHLDAVSIYSDQFRQFFHQIYQIIQRLLYLKFSFDKNDSLKNMYALLKTSSSLIASKQMQKISLQVSDNFDPTLTRDLVHYK